ncbi:glutathione S-transferase [Polychytrium aggregatum]|uniref:glutathione S-transferase n=1 Tax=Polychytrium aggregatum TaxID=110093 RepID=UPI0022FF2497|nr:glutathione S-transferase [Polychytrium aggregatum]KAI9209105.1 glutathione S-transferase [Polychytrium aggregatum]
MSITKPTSLKLTYFDMPGKAETSRLAFFVGGIEFEDERLTREQFQALKPSLPFGQVPILTINGELVIAQSKAILHYAGILSGLYPGNDDLLATLLIDQVVEAIEDIWLKLRSCIFETDEAKKSQLRQALISDVYPPMLAAFDKFLEKHSGAYAVGNSVSIADLRIYIMFDMLSGSSPHVAWIPNDLIAPYANIARVFNSIKAHPRVVEWEAKNAARQK